MAAIRAALYVRVSTEGQDSEDKTSLSEQVSEIETYCESKGYTITARYQDIASGVKRDRAGFQWPRSDASGRTAR